VARELEELVRRADHADREATDKLFVILYHELHRLADSNLRRAGGAFSLATTTLLHEAYLDMARREHLAFADQSHFLAYASRAMRRLIIDYARNRRAKKRGRQFEVTLATDDEALPQSMEDAAAFERLGDALNDLGQLEPALAELVDLHFFCGFSLGEIATLRRVSERTVQRDWRKARMLLHHALLDPEHAA
jgi:RNA polymerase sigma factor (TIGR02999 family)